MNKYLISTFKFAVILSLLLNSIIGQMDHLIAEILKRKRGGTGPDIPFLVPIRFQ